MEYLYKSQSCDKVARSFKLTSTSMECINNVTLLLRASLNLSSTLFIVDIVLIVFTSIRIFSFKFTLNYLVLEIELVWEDFERNGNIVHDQYSPRYNRREPEFPDFLNNLCKLTLQGMPLKMIFKLLEARCLRICKFCQNLGAYELGYLPVTSIECYGLTCTNCESNYPGVYITYPKLRMVSSYMLHS